MNHNQSPIKTGLIVEYPQAFSPEHTLLVPVGKDSVDTTPVAAYAEANGFEPKDEYHFTIIGNREIIEQMRAKLEQQEGYDRRTFRQALDAIIPLLGAAKLKPGAYHHVTKLYQEDGQTTRRESVIQEATIDGINEFHHAYAHIVGSELGTPFPHLTLFTKGDNPESHIGIGIPSAEVFSALEHTSINV